EQVAEVRREDVAHSLDCRGSCFGAGIIRVVQPHPGLDRLHSAERRLPSLGVVADQLPGLGQVGENLCINLGSRRTRYITDLRGTRDGLQAEWYTERAAAAPQLDQVVIGKSTDEIRLTDDLVLLARRKVGDTRHLLNQLVGAVDHVVR